MKNDRAPRNDMIHCYWIKKLRSTHKSIVNEFKQIYENEGVSKGDGIVFNEEQNKMKIVEN